MLASETLVLEQGTLGKEWPLQSGEPTGIIPVLVAHTWHTS